MIKILQGNCIDKIKELEDNSIDCVVSSPPYFGLRDYGVDGQFGLEKTYQDYLTNTVKVFEAFKPKLKDTATIWWNVGDSYSSGLRKSTTNQSLRGSKDYGVTRTPIQNGIKEKDLLMIPNRVAIALQDAGWYIRSEIIWHKPNPMPESTKDRPTSCHEKIWLITKSKKYYYDADAIKEPTKHPNANKNKRNVWTVTTKPFKKAHFATFPKDLIKPCIKAGCPVKVCIKCGVPYKRNTNRNTNSLKVDNSTLDRYGNGEAGVHRKIGGQYQKWLNENPLITIGWKKQCDCQTEKTKNGIVLDPFSGAGTTGIVAKSLNRKSILIELNPQYIEIAQKRIEEEFGLFND
tara:strand:+ start:54 stop:1094 length:1041 start_codon:yes stop_codon:yes gene_type:complete